MHLSKSELAARRRGVEASEWRRTETSGSPESDRSAAEWFAVC